jgi:AcrR family transcriptional regulator
MLVETDECVDPVEVDGRRQRGVASRRAILAAASLVIVEDGVDALTHRAVAEAAGMPLARISYHFPKIEDLLLAAAAQYLDDFDDRLQAGAEGALAARRSMVDACTDFLFELVTTRSREFLAMVEVRLALKRRGRSVDHRGVIDVIRSFGAEPRRASSIMAAMFGYAVLAATAPEPVTRTQVRTFVRSALGGAA